MKKNGFTLPELLITMAILSIVFGFVTINLVHLQHSSALNATLDTLVSDLKSQQNKAMTGEAISGTLYDYGVHFDTNKYTLFRGSSYNPLDTSNFDIKLDPSLTFSSITDIVFQKGNGEVAGAPISVTLKDTTNNEQKTIQINVYGAITIL